MTTWYNGDDDHVEHVVEQQGDADGHQDKLALVLWLLFTNTMCRMMKEMITIGMIIEKAPGGRPTIPGARRPRPELIRIQDLRGSDLSLFDLIRIVIVMI